MEQFDAIVVGSSVAGSPTATWLARKGYKVLLVDKASFPRDTNSTHFVWPRGVSYLNRLGVADKVIASTPHFTNLEVNIEGIRLRGHVPIADIRKRFLALHGDDHGVVGYYSGPRRFHLDQLLLDNARESGVDVRLRTALRGVIVEDGRVVGIHAVDADGKDLHARAKVVIGADGRVSSFASLVGSKTVHVRERSTFAYYGYFSGIQKPELVIHKKGRFGTAIFPTNHDNHLALVYGPTAWWSDFSSDPATNFLRIYRYVAPDVAELVVGARRTEPFKAMGRMVAYHRENWGNGWALVGDAGSFKDQWTAMGITHALRDAELISQYLDSYLRGDASWSDAMTAYASVRMEDYEGYWNFVCDGAEMSPYTNEQLAYFKAVSEDQDAVNKLIGQIGDTVKFDNQIALPETKLAAHSAHYRTFEPAGRMSFDSPFKREVKTEPAPS
jgi:flavin-dependent dehydrogenase